MNKLKLKYNFLLKRLKKAIIFLDDNEIEISEREKFVPAYRKLVDDMQELLFQIGKWNYTTEHILNGFYIEEIEIEPHEHIQINISA